MNRIPFEIKYRPQIETGEYKVVTECLDEVSILRWDIENPNGCLLYTYKNIKTGMEWPVVGDGSQLFLVPKEQLTEFEQAIYTHICSIVTACDGKVYGDKELNPIVKGIAKELLDIARKEILKDLPKWKKANVFVSNECGLAQRNGDLIITKCGYQIKISDLEKLPKEE